VETARKEEPKETVSLRLPREPIITPDDEVLTLGTRERQDSKDRNRESDFEMEVRLDPRGGGVRSVILNKFQAADAEGRPVWKRGADGNLLQDERGRRIPEVLALVPDDPRNPSHLLYHFDPEDKGEELKDKKPFDTLGRRKWDVVGEDGQVVREGGKAVVEDTVEVDGKATKRQTVRFQTEVAGVRITRTWSLVAGQYHVGMEVKLERLEKGKGGDEKPLKFRYQVTGAHGLPVEGKWYTSTFRNVLIALQDDQGRIDRTLVELRQAESKNGTEVRKQIEKDKLKFLRYAGVAVQYFASVIAVDNDQKDEHFLAQAIPIHERAAFRGTIRKVRRYTDQEIAAESAGHPGWQASAGSFVLLNETDKKEYIFQVPAAHADLLDLLQAGRKAAVISRTTPYDPNAKTGDQVDEIVEKNPDDTVARRRRAAPRIAVDVRLGEQADAVHPLWEDDLTVRVNTEEIDLQVGQPVVHKYLLYNGPVKVSQLYYLEKDRQVSRSLINRYLDDLHLDTLTDYHSPGGFAEFWWNIGWTKLVVRCTNLMHWILGWIHFFVPSYGLCIILLTVLVRGLMFPLSRKQALMGIKMQELGPEMKKLAEKYHDDPQQRQMAQMELFRKHGVNPVGGCWVMLLQMPILMGLYYALQESSLFRLGSFWPMWITNLAAPDMLFPWSDRIYWISRPEDYGSFLYLGPYFNLLPILAVALMIVQQKMYTPPPADEQQAAQQSMMKYMMIFFGLMFYKMASGLCVYFIASSVWGFAERRLLPKRKEAVPGPDGLATAASVPATVPAASTDSVNVTTQPTSRPTGVTTAPSKGRSKAGRGKRKGERAEPRKGANAQESAVGQLRERLSNWWTDLLEKARKK
jgi:YidC/Oxa1 family membrane protein insertase